MHRVSSLEPNDAASAAQAARLHNVEAIRIPTIRALGLLTVLVVVAIHDRLLLGEFSSRSYAVLAICFAAYAAVSWLILHLYYRKPRGRMVVNLGWLFHLCDLVACTLAVYFSGGERSWLFFVILVPVWNQTHYSAARSIISGALAAFLYLLMLTAVPLFEDREILIGPASLRAGLILLVTMYCGFSAWVVERGRRQMVDALRLARRNAEQQASRLASLNRLSQAVVATGELEEVLAVAAREMVTLFDVTNCAITMRDEERRMLRVLAFHSRRENAPDVRGYEIPYLSNPSCNAALMTQRPVIVKDAQTSPMTVAVHDVLRLLDVYVVMVVPMILHGEPIGTISIQSGDRERQFNDGDSSLAETAAAQIAPVIGNAVRFREERESRQLAETLHEAASAINETLELSEVLRRIMEQLQKVIAFDGAAIHLVEGGAMRIIATQGHPASEIGHVRQLSTHAFNRHLATHDEPVVLDLPVSSEFFKQDPHLDEVRSVMGLPLVLHDRIIGAMTVDSYSRNAYTQKHAARAMSFARIAAIAVEHARLYQSLRNDEAALRDAKRQLEMSNDHLRELSSSDALTGLSNRRFFEEVFTLEWRRSVRSHAPLSVIMIDVDDFKLYNDHYGHPAGDEVLRSVAMALRNSLQRAGDMVARYGGEEFIALLPSTDLVSATQHAERLRWRVEQLAIEHLASRNGAAVVTISVGVATAFAREDCDRSSLLIAADQQLYVAKRQGRNRVSAAHLIAQPMPLRERTTDA